MRRGRCFRTMGCGLGFGGDRHVNLLAVAERGCDAGLCSWMQPEWIDSPSGDIGSVTPMLKSGGCDGIQATDGQERMAFAVRARWMVAVACGAALVLSVNLQSAG